MTLIKLPRSSIEAQVFINPDKISNIFLDHQERDRLNYTDLYFIKIEFDKENYIQFSLLKHSSLSSANEELESAIKYIHEMTHNKKMQNKIDEIIS